MAVCRSMVNQRRYYNVKRLMFVLIISLAFNMVFALSSFLKSTADGSPVITYQNVEVRQGDTLWTIAKTYGGQEDLRKVVYDIKKVNELNDSIIQPGQNLKIPLTY